MDGAGKRVLGVRIGIGLPREVQPHGDILVGAVGVDEPQAAGIPMLISLSGGSLSGLGPISKPPMVCTPVAPP
jgi:hypothetical protein